MKNIIVTGGCGFIGSNFVRWVAEHHPQVRFNEDCLPIGAAAHTAVALAWLEKQSA